MRKEERVYLTDVIRHYQDADLYDQIIPTASPYLPQTYSAIEEMRDDEAAEDGEVRDETTYTGPQEKVGTGPKVQTPLGLRPVVQSPPGLKTIQLENAWKKPIQHYSIGVEKLNQLQRSTRVQHSRSGVVDAVNKTLPTCLSLPSFHLLLLTLLSSLRLQ